MAKGSILTLTGQVTKENGKMVKDMEKDPDNDTFEGINFDRIFKKIE